VPLLSYIQSKYNPFLPNYKILRQQVLTTLSVPRLALFTRLLIDVGTLQTGSRSSILRKIAASLSTAKTGSICEENLRIKFYTPQTAAINIIKEYLYKMINLLRDY